MKNLNAFIVIISLILTGMIISIYSKIGLYLYLIILIILEISSYLLISKLREKFQWLITKKDELPELNKEGLKKFIKHGYDKELGWTRKPNTKKEEIGRFGKTSYSINKDGTRKNPNHQRLPHKISCYGDSFVFSRQVNDNETWEWQLSELTKTNVKNLGVGNYGLDQALLKLKKEHSKNKGKIIIMGVVPSTIVRILCVWKHYNEFGNTFGFKPRYILENNKLKLIKNFINTKERLFNYKKYISKIRQYDYFYKSKFKDEMIHFPNILSILSNPLRNIPLITLVSWYRWFAKDNLEGGYPKPMEVIMKINLKLREYLFTKDKYAVELLTKIAEEFSDYGKKMNFTPIFIFMPQKDDLIKIKKENKSYYDNFIKKVSSFLTTIDLTTNLIKRNNLDDIYSDDNEYGGHYNKIGNKFISKIIYKRLKEEKIL